MKLRILRFLWTWPLPANESYISQGFGVVSSRGTHPGIDIACPVGTPIYAARAGTVAFTDPVGLGPAGQFIIVKVAGVQRWYGYEDLSSIWVKPGDAVKKGQQIGKSGMSGNSTGPHLHFEVDSVPYLASYDKPETALDPFLFLTLPSTVRH